MFRSAANRQGIVIVSGKWSPYIDRNPLCAFFLMLHYTASECIEYVQRDVFHLLYTLYSKNWFEWLQFVAYRAVTLAYVFIILVAAFIMLHNVFTGVLLYIKGIAVV